MKVILLEDVRKVGKKGEVVEVKDGYARNVLFRNNKAKEATRSNINELHQRQKYEDKLEQERYEEALKNKKAMENWEVLLSIKTGEGGKTFGTISPKQIEEAVKEQFNVTLDKKKFVIDEPIKSLGAFNIKVKLHPDVIATLKLKIKEAD